MMKPGDLIVVKDGHFIDFSIKLYKHRANTNSRDQIAGLIKGNTVGLIVAAFPNPNKFTIAGDHEIMVVFPGPLFGWTWSSRLRVVSG